MRTWVCMLVVLALGIVKGEEGWLFVRNVNDGEVSLAIGYNNAGSEWQALNIQHSSSSSYYLLENTFSSIITPEWLQINSLGVAVIYQSSKCLLVAMERGKEGGFMDGLPKDVEIVRIIPDPMQSQKQSAHDIIAKIAATPLVHDDAIQDLVDQVNEDDLRNFVEYLTGELKGSPLLTRNSYSDGAVEASEWIQAQFASFGLKTTLQCYDSDVSCNVVGILPGTTIPDEVIVLGGHYDSRSTSLTSPTQRAPGANDDGSGTGTLLQIAKIISANSANFARTIHFVAFSGEEQGLLGSQAYATSLVDDKVTVVAMIQNDMIAYRAPNTGYLCGFPERYTTPALTAIAIDATNTYSPEVNTGRNNRCCSDHRSFYERGFPATDFSDTHGPIVDPEYHKSGDLVNRPGFDLGKYAGIVKGYFATAAVVAQLVA